MEAWRQWLLGGRKNLVQRENNQIHLTPTGLLMEGVYAHNRLVMSKMAIFHQSCWSALITDSNCKHAKASTLLPFDLERSAQYWDFASTRAIKHAPHGEILGNVLQLMLDSRSHKEQIA